MIYTKDEYLTMNAATVVCLRRSKLIGTNCWQVLLTQNEVKNWLRSTPEEDVLMRYPGEWKFPGGVCELGDESFKHTAIRELKEELIGIPNIDVYHISLHLLNKKLTKPIKGKRYWMHNYVAFDSENPWMTDEIDKIVNENLQMKMQEFHNSIASGKFWELDEEQKMILSPEVHRVAWIDIHKAIELMGSSLSRPCQFVNEWQARQFMEYGILKRDPMYQSMTVLQEIQTLDTIESMIEKENHFTQLER